MTSRIRSVLTVLVLGLATVLATPATGHAVGTITSHLDLSVNNPSCAGCTVSGTVSLWFDDFTDATGSVIHMERSLDGVVTPLPDIVLASSGNSFSDTASLAGEYVYRAWFDGDALHAPAEATATVTVERRQNSIGMNVWSGRRGTVQAYAFLAGCHLDCTVVFSAGTASRGPWEVARATVPEGGGYTPTVTFKPQGATRFYASYAGDDWWLPAQTVWAYRI